MDPKITQYLKDWHAGNSGAFDNLIPLIQNELRQLARKRLAGERPNHPLQPTALINEFYLRCLEAGPAPELEGRVHFYAFAAMVMRRILVEHARKQNAQRRGGEFARATITNMDDCAGDSGIRELDILALDQALERLNKIDPLQSKITELRYFAGLNNEEIGKALDIGERSVSRKWAVARLWLFKFLSNGSA